MKAMRHALHHPFAHAAGEQGIDQADAQRHFGHGVETQYHDRTADGADRLARGVVKDAVGKLEHLGGHRRILQDHLGESLRGCAIVVGDLSHVGHGGAEGRHLVVADMRHPARNVAWLSGSGRVGQVEIELRIHVVLYDRRAPTLRAVATLGNRRADPAARKAKGALPGALDASRESAFSSACRGSACISCPSRRDRGRCDRPWVRY